MKLEKAKELFLDQELQSLLLSDTERYKKHTFAKTILKNSNAPKYVPLYLDCLQRHHQGPLQSTARKLLQLFIKKTEKHNEYKTCAKNALGQFDQKVAENFKFVSAAAEKAKSKEWHALYHALYTASKELCVDFSLPHATSDILIQNRLQRLVENCYAYAALSRQNVFRTVSTYSIESIQTLCDTLKIPQTHYLSSLLQSLELSPELFATEYDALKNACHQIQLLFTGTTNERESIIQCIKTLHTAIENRAYKIVCIYESNPCVRFLHHICFALFAKADLVPVYRSFIDEIQTERAPVTPSNLRSEIEGALLKVGTPKSGRVEYKSHLSKDADAHSNDNISGHLFDELYHLNDQNTLTVHRVIGPAYTGSYWQGNTINPVLLAVLQAMENRHLLPVENDLNPYYGLILSNMQQFSQESEKQACLSLMQLAPYFPHSLSAITLHSHQSDSSITKEATLTQLSERTLKCLQDDTNFTLLSDRKSDYYFPLHQKEMWHRLFVTIVEEAKKTAFKNQTQATSNSTIAFFQLIKLAILRQHELHSIRYFTQNALPSNAKLITFCVCKAGLDRAGHSNAALTWILGNENSERIASQIFLAKPLLSRGHEPRRNHRNRLVILSETVTKEDARLFLECTEANIEDNDEIKSLQFDKLSLKTKQ